jgi:hypothetical protein
MPVWQYVLFVGGALMALLFAANCLLPTPARNELINSGARLPVIRVRSERRPPEAVVIGTTNVPMLATQDNFDARQANVEAVPLPEQASVPLVSRLVQLADAGRMNTAQVGQKQNHGTASPEGRHIAHRHFDSMRRERSPTTRARSGPEFGGTFAQFVPWPSTPAGRGEPRTRDGMMAFSQGRQRDTVPPCCAIFADRRAEVAR